jgi:hypothetical protein
MDMTLDQLLTIFICIPPSDVRQFFAIPLVPWLVAFSIPFLVTRFRADTSATIRAIYSICLIGLSGSYINGQKNHNCYLDVRDGMVMVEEYSGRKCRDSRIVMWVHAGIGAVVILRRAWR